MLPAIVLVLAAAPADDLARLVYANWLDDHGNPTWAAAIRVMCAQPHEFDADVQVERMGVGRRRMWQRSRRGWGQPRLTTSR